MFENNLLTYTSISRNSTNASSIYSGNKAHTTILVTNIYVTQLPANRKWVYVGVAPINERN